MIHPLILFFQSVHCSATLHIMECPSLTHPFGTVFLSFSSFFFFVALNHFISWDLTKTFMFAVNQSIPFTYPHLHIFQISVSFSFFHPFSTLPISFRMNLAFCSFFLAFKLLQNNFLIVDNAVTPSLSWKPFLSQSSETATYLIQNGLMQM